MNNNTPASPAIQGKIKNPAKVEELLANGEWEIDPDQEANQGQLNFLGDDETYYDAETDQICKI